MEPIRVTIKTVINTCVSSVDTELGLMTALNAVDENKEQSESKNTALLDACLKAKSLGVV